MVPVGIDYPQGQRRDLADGGVQVVKAVAGVNQQGLRRAAQQGHVHAHAVSQAKDAGRKLPDVDPAFHDIPPLRTSKHFAAKRRDSCAKHPRLEN